MNKTLEFYRKLAEAYKEHGFEDYAVAELWAALEKAVLANTELLEGLEATSMLIENSSKSAPNYRLSMCAAAETVLPYIQEVIRKHKGE